MASSGWTLLAQVDISVDRVSYAPNAALKSIPVGVVTLVGDWPSLTWIRGVESNVPGGSGTTCVMLAWLMTSTLVGPTFAYFWLLTCRIEPAVLGGAESSAEPATTSEVATVSPAKTWPVLDDTW